MGINDTSRHSNQCKQTSRGISCILYDDVCHPLYCDPASDVIYSYSLLYYYLYDTAVLGYAISIWLGRGNKQ